MSGRWLAPSVVVGSLLVGLAPAQATSPAGYGFPAPAFAGAFLNVLGDRLDLTVTGDRAAGRWVAGGGAWELRGTVAGGSLRGTAQNGSGPERACRGEFHGDVLHFALGDETWRLQPAAPLQPSLAELGAPDVDPQRRWTIAVYLGADNDLEAGALADLHELRQGLPKQGVEVVVLIDRAKGFATSATDWTDARLLRVQSDPQAPFVELGRPGELDTGSAVTLGSFVAGAFRKFPAPHHAVFVWDHGGGWTGIVSDHDAPGRPRGRSQLSLADVRHGLRSGLLHSGVLRLDLVAFDACLMAQLEVALAMADLATVMVASEAVVPGTGFPYDRSIAHFGTSTDPRAIGRSIVADYARFSENAFESGSTLSAFDLAFAPAVAAQLDGLARSLLGCADAQWAAIARALFYAESYEVRPERVADAACGSLDLLDLVSRLRTVPGVDRKAIDHVEITFAGMLLNRHRGAERTLSQGLAVYGPHRQGQYDAGYRDTPLGAGSAWPRLLQRVHDRAAADASELSIGDFRMQTALGAATDTAHPFGGERVLFTATGNSIVEVVQNDLQHDPEGRRWLLLRKQLVTDPLWPARWDTALAADMIDLVMPEFREGRNELFTELSGMLFAIADGTLSTYATLDMATPSMQAPITALARYEPVGGGDPQVVQVSFDRSLWNVVSVRPIARPGAGSVARSIEPAAGDKFCFLLETTSDAGEAGGLVQEPLVWGKAGLYLQPEFDEPGRYRAQMVARTIHGRTATAHHDYVVAGNPDLLPWPKSWEGVDPAVLVGTWRQFRVVGPQQYADLRMTATIEQDPKHPHSFLVRQKGGQPGRETETLQQWAFEFRGLPCLRILCQEPDGRRFCWYGPTLIGERDGKRFLVMKSLNTGGVIWEWRQQ